MRVLAIVLVTSGAVLAAFSACKKGLQDLPVAYPLRTPDATGNPGLSCAQGAPHGPRVAQVDVGPFAFDVAAHNWHTDGAAFAAHQPIAAEGIAAQLVHPRWTAPQRRELPKGAKESELVPLGGNYWSHTQYPIVSAPGERWISSRYAAGASQVDDRGNGLTGSMWTAVLLEQPFLRVMIGGDDDREGTQGDKHGRVGVELLVEPSAAAAAAQCLNRQRHEPFALRPPPGYEGYVRALVWYGDDQEALRTLAAPLDGPECSLRGARALLRIFDASPNHHVNVGPIALVDALAPAVPPAVWGFADYHTHPTDYLGFGGLQDDPILWGVPGGGVSEYVGDDDVSRVRIGRDIPPCDANYREFNGHQGGFAAPVMINATEGRTSENIGDLSHPPIADVHPPHGAPGFEEFPDFRRGAHMQYHITQIHRAYLGGLRLMTALAVHNRGLEYGTGWVTCGANGAPTVQTTPDWTVIAAHVQAMRELATLNSEWMAIAYTPEDAREIIRSNRLAVVLGVEVPQLGEDEPGDDFVERQVARLDELGIRQVVVVHGMDNLLGGTAVFQNLYNTVNDWMHRPAAARDAVLEYAGIAKKEPFARATFFDATTEASPETRRLSPQDAAMEPIVFRLGDPARVVLSDVFPHPGSLTFPIGPLTFGPLHPLVATVPFFDVERGWYDQLGPGQRNKRGLTGRGIEFVRSAMAHGLLVDMAHMSDQTVVDTDDKAAGGACGEYPLMVSHAHFRRLAVKNDYTDRLDDFLSKTTAWVQKDLLASPPKPMSACVRDHTKCNQDVLGAAQDAADRAPWLGSGTVDAGNLSREYELSAYEVDRLSKRGGVVGVFLGEGPMNNQAPVVPSDLKGLPFSNDCAGSSKSFATAMLYAQQRMDQGGVGLASDFTFVNGVSPRFGEAACGAYLGAGSGGQSGAQLLETLTEPEQYQFQFGRQEAPVTYASPEVDTCGPGHATYGGVDCGNIDAPLLPYTMGRRRPNDFNVDGLAHYGLLPDLLQDVANIMASDPRPDRHLQRLFGSAEAFIEMWEAARRVVGCEKAGSKCGTRRTPDDPLACGDRCPSRPNHGAPLQALAELYDACAPGDAVRFPTRDPGGNVVDARAVYTQHQADPHRRAEGTREQGDWAIYPIHTRQTWMCGSGKEQSLQCPSGANYVKVRRVLDTTVGRHVEHCDWQPLPPEDGNRRVVFQCLAGPERL